MATGGTVVHLDCYEPGQVTPMHKNPEEDAVLFLGGGAGFIRFETKDGLPFKAGVSSAFPANSITALTPGPMGE